MSKTAKSFNPDIGDSIALKIQKWRMEGKLKSGRPLLRIDNRNEAADAPFQFDSVRSILHRTGCKAIPRESHSALYAVWTISPEDLKFACEKCKPDLDDEDDMSNNKDTFDIIFGFISLIDQFSSVLIERGREFRNSRQGRKIEGEMENLISELDKKQKDAVNVLISSLDGVIKAINTYNDQLGAGSNGHNGNGALKKKDGKAAFSGKNGKKKKSG